MAWCVWQALQGNKVLVHDSRFVGFRELTQAFKLEPSRLSTSARGLKLHPCSSTLHLPKLNVLSCDSMAALSASKEEVEPAELSLYRRILLWNYYQMWSTLEAGESFGFDEDQKPLPLTFKDVEVSINGACSAFRSQKNKWVSRQEAITSLRGG